VIVDVAPRRNGFSRRSAAVRPVEQVLAANIDQIVLVVSLSHPEFKPGFADRVLAQAEHASIPARLVVNKTDLGDQAELDGILDAYGRAGYPGLPVSARSGEGVEPLRALCAGRRTMFVGHSGVGKSTLLNRIAPGLGLLAGEVNRVTGKGRHTTTAAVLQFVPPDLELIDTPGMRGFGLWDIGDLAACYPEFRPFLGHCRFGDCRHDQEPGCALREAVEAGGVSRRRFDSFHKLRDELEEERSLERPRTGGRP
jgi:ribosome biogenesis GTPase